MSSKMILRVYLSHTLCCQFMANDGGRCEREDSESTAIFKDGCRRQSMKTGQGNVTETGQPG